MGKSEFAKRVTVGILFRYQIKLTTTELMYYLPQNALKTKIKSFNKLNQYGMFCNYLCIDYYKY